MLDCVIDLALYVTRHVHSERLGRIRHRSHCPAGAVKRGNREEHIHPETVETCLDRCRIRPLEFGERRRPRVLKQAGHYSGLVHDGYLLGLLLRHEHYHGREGAKGREQHRNEESGDYE